MPTYDYRCDANGQIIEVKHRMSEEVKTWGELCERAGIDIGDTPINSSVKRLPTGGQVVKSSNIGNTNTPACSMPSCCGGVCGLD